MRLGSMERKIMAWLNDPKTICPRPIEAVYKFAHFRHKAGDRTGYTDFSQIWKVLDRMEAKGWIEIENRRRTDSRIYPLILILTEADMGHIPKRIGRCRQCGGRYRQKDQRDDNLCPTCRWEKKGDATSNLVNGVSGARIVNDPLEPGGFAPGVYFTNTEVLKMILSGGFTDGTVVESRGLVFVYRAEKRDFEKIITKAGRRPGRPRKVLQPAAE